MQTECEYMASESIFYITSWKTQQLTQTITWLVSVILCLCSKKNGSETRGRRKV